MKSSVKTPCVRIAAISFILGMISVIPIHAQTFIVLHSFTNTEGADPDSLMLVSNVLYGETASGGSHSVGTFFSLNTDGTGFTNLHAFGGDTNGNGPSGGFLPSGNLFYGTAHNGGFLNFGTVFRINTDGTSVTNLHNFANTTSNCSEPSCALVLSGNTLYGTATSGGKFSDGAVFSVNTDGSGYTNLYSFSNALGILPQSGLVLSGNILYGTTKSGGQHGGGTVFAIHTDGSGFTNLYHFSGPSDGSEPIAPLLLSGDTLYGTTSYYGGPTFSGTIFAIKTNGSGFTVLHQFISTNDGASPEGGLILSGQTLYGTAANMGALGGGTVFAINTDGTGFTNLHNFTGGADGAGPASGLAISGVTLYGTATRGGTNGGSGTVFSIFIQPRLGVTTLGRNLILTWPTNASAFTLQSTTSLTPPNWTNVLPAPDMTTGQYIVSNFVSNPQTYYRLRQ